jgi:predicted RNA-binding protein YlxR (DUF448 family)
VIPERTCVGCRDRSPKRGLIRVVRSAAGDVEADPWGAAPGRGAYVHPDGACIDTALDGGGLARGLRVGLAPEVAVRLRADLERLMGAV